MMLHQVSHPPEHNNEVLILVHYSKDTKCLFKDGWKIDRWINGKWANAYNKDYQVLGWAELPPRPSEENIFTPFLSGQFR